MEVPVISKELLVNHQIRDREVRLIDSDGSQLGVVSVRQAQSIASSKSLDLVKIAPHAKPPVCKIMDYGKYKFELAKKEKKSKKNQHVISVKEVRISPAIDVHDFDTKVKHALKFLKSGNKVKVTVKFRGREVLHSAKGKELLERFADAVVEKGVVEKKPRMEGRNMIMFLVPKQ